MDERKSCKGCKLRGTCQEPCPEINALANVDQKYLRELTIGQPEYSKEELELFQRHVSFEDGDPRDYSDISLHDLAVLVLLKNFWTPEQMAEVLHMTTRNVYSIMKKLQIQKKLKS